jgi:hypothetical protein
VSHTCTTELMKHVFPRLRRPVRPGTSPRCGTRPRSPCELHARTEHMHIASRAGHVHRRARHIRGRGVPQRDGDDATHSHADDDAPRHGLVCAARREHWRRRSLRIRSYRDRGGHGSDVLLETASDVGPPTPRVHDLGEQGRLVVLHSGLFGALHTHGASRRV